MTFHPMFHRKYYWAVCNRGGVFPDAAAMTRSRAIRRFEEAYLVPWSVARKSGHTCKKIIISMHG
jgi:hypothetical protein